MSGSAIVKQALPRRQRRFLLLRRRLHLLADRIRLAGERCLVGRLCLRAEGLLEFESVLCIRSWCRRSGNSGRRSRFCCTLGRCGGLLCGRHAGQSRLDGGRVRCRLLLLLGRGRRSDECEKEEQRDERHAHDGRADQAVCKCRRAKGILHALSPCASRVGLTPRRPLSPP